MTSRHHRRVHRPHDAGPALLRRSAPGARSQGRRQDPAGKPDPGLDHLPELFPPVRQAGRHDRHGLHRGGGIRRHLWLDVVEIPTNVPVAAYRRGRRGLPHRARKSTRRSSNAIKACPASAEAAGSGRHHLDREIGNSRRSPEARGHSAQCAQRPLSRAGSQIVAQAGVPGAVTIATNMAGRGTDIQLGGNADMRIARNSATCPRA
jgi:hypothetical protein